MLFGVNTTRSCFNVTAVDDNIDEDTLETVEFRISQTRQNQGFIQVSPSAVTARLGILDDDCKSLCMIMYRYNARDCILVYCGIMPQSNITR